MFHADGMYELARCDHQVRLDAAARRRWVRVDQPADSHHWVAATASVRWMATRLRLPLKRAAQAPTNSNG